MIIRASSLPGYTDCQRRWAAQNLMKEANSLGYEIKSRLPKSIGASVGTATHAGVAKILSDKMRGDANPDGDAEGLAVTEFGESLDKEPVMWDETTENVNQAQKQIIRMVRSYRLTIAGEITPIAVEQRLEANVGNDIILSGQSDVQTFEAGRIRDLKTGKSKRQHYGQLGAYSLLSRSVHPEHNVQEICVDFVQRTHLSELQPDPVTEFYDQATAEQAASHALNDIKMKVDEFGKRAAEGDMPPEHVFLANPSSMLCNPRYCPAFGTNFCREHRK